MAPDLGGRRVALDFVAWALRPLKSNPQSTTVPEALVSLADRRRGSEMSPPEITHCISSGVGHRHRGYISHPRRNLITLLRSFMAVSGQKAV
ncbi:unnamed protein product [Arabis nemorensis]|uniref:Uncharacterized protein n=1 Tax=Arabis nemorensis TaxID=586526 RepID=A0A565BFF1_9BRAS|nr:unnamed protein product [Arabis nemorensis]